MSNAGACYLMFEQLDGGTMSYVYSAVALPNYLAKAEGGKPVPAWKFKAGGKNKLKNNVTTVRDFFVCWCTWLKEMKRNGDTITVGSATQCPSDCMVVKHIAGGSNKVEKCGTKFNMEDADAIACVPSANQDFNTPTMDLKLFVEKGNKSYAALSLI